MRGGATLQTIFEICDELGYDVSWAIYNSKDYGVPQNRERIFIKGYFREKCSGEVLSVPRVNKTVNVAKLSNTYYGSRNGRVHKDDEIMNCLATQGHNGGSAQLIQINNYKKTTQSSRVYDDKGLSVTINAAGNNGIYRINKVGNVRHGSQGGNVYHIDGIGPTLIASGYKDQVKIIEPKIKVVGNVSTTGHHSDNTLDDDGLSTTVTATGHPIKVRTNTQKGYDELYPNDGIRLDHPNSKTGRGRTQKDKTGALTCNCQWGTLTEDYLLRKLTPVECERLQAFPDNWTKYGKDGEIISDTQRYKCVGNAVTTTVITYLADEMFKHLEEEKEE